MNIYAKKGSKVVFTGKNGSDWDQQDAQKRLIIGSVYTVKRTDVGNWSSTVEFQEVEGSYNTVLFDDWEVEAKKPATPQLLPAAFIDDKHSHLWVMNDSVAVFNIAQAEIVFRHHFDKLKVYGISGEKAKLFSCYEDAYEFFSG